jgi:hypothetical protein
VEYAEFDAERRSIVRAWGREITDPEQLAAAVERLRRQAGTVPDEADRARAIRYLRTLDDLVTEARTPESETVRRAGDVSPTRSSTWSSRSSPHYLPARASALPRSTSSTA